MNSANKNLLSDIEINRIIKSLDNTITTYGTTKFEELFNIICYDNNLLNRRQEILTSIVSHDKKRKHIIKILKKIHKLEKYIIWLFEDRKKLHDTNEQDPYDNLLFKNNSFNIQSLLTFTNALKIYSPSFLIIWYIFMYCLLLRKGIHIDIKEYITGVYKSTTIFVQGILHMFITDTNLSSFIANIFTTTYFVWQIYSMYSSFGSSYNHYTKCRDFNKHFEKLKELIALIKKLYKHDVFMVPEKHLLKIKLDNIEKLYINYSLGYNLLLKKNKHNHEDDLSALLQYVGLIDAFINISNLVMYKGYSFPIFDFNSNKPYINALNIWNPLYDLNSQIYNDCIMGDNGPNIFIITGPNTSGKSTYIRNVIINIFLSQTIGISPCQQIKFTPFYNLFTYIDIPNISRVKESLFEAEIKRCMEYCGIVNDIPSNMFVLTVMDELFTGTNPQEGISSSYAVCDYLSGFSNGLLLITTHFNELTKLEDKDPIRFKNKKFMITKNWNGSFYDFSRSYKIMDGVNNQNIAIDLLEQKGYNNIIITKAKRKLRELEDKFS